MNHPRFFSSRQLSELTCFWEASSGTLPTPTAKPKPCHTCRHYVGRTIEGSGALRGELCCAMHPYGPDGSECPDWEKLG